MGSINHGIQDTTLNFYEEATALNFNMRNMNIQPRGIYKGGYLTRIGDLAVSLSALTVEIGDTVDQVAISTTSAAALNNTTDPLDSGIISSATPYLVLRWAYAGVSANYMEIHAVALIDILYNDIVIGKCNFSGAALATTNTFDYAARTLVNVQNLFLKVEADAGLYVRSRGGRIYTPTGYIVVPSQRILFTVPAVNSRIDLVYITEAGVAAVQQGAEAISPVAPSYVGRLVVAEITISSTDTFIAAAQIVDVRSFITVPTFVDDVTIEKSNGELQVKDGSIGLSQITSFLGTRTNKDSLGNTLVKTSVYKATSDGYIKATAVGSRHGSGTLTGYVGASNPPTTLLDANGSGYVDVHRSGISLVVKKNEYWKIITTYMGTPTIYWQPIGSGQCVKQ